MSQIDQYRHTILGFAQVVSPYEIVYCGNNNPATIVLYRLDEDGIDYPAKSGDVLFGGGDGEAPALRIEIPEAFYFFTHTLEVYDPDEPPMKAYWSMTQAFVMGDACVRLGWHPSRQSVEFWLTKHVLSFLLQHYPQIYAPLNGGDTLEYDGSILQPRHPGTLEWLI